MPRRTEKAKYGKPPFSSAKSIGSFSRESFPASPIFGLRLLGNDSFFVIITPLTQERLQLEKMVIQSIEEHPRLRGKDRVVESKQQ